MVVEAAMQTQTKDVVIRVPLTGIFEIPAPLKAVDQAIELFFAWRKGKDRNPPSPSGIVTYSLPILCHLGGCANYSDGVFDDQYEPEADCRYEPKPDEAPNYEPEKLNVCLRETANPEMTKVEMRVIGLGWQRTYDLVAAEVESQLGDWAILGDVNRGQFGVDYKTFTGEKRIKRQCGSYSQYVCYRGRVRWQRTITEALLSHLRTEFGMAILPKGENRKIELGRRRGGPIATPEDQMIEIVNGWLKAQGEETQECYCSRKGIAPSTLRNWVRQLRAKGKLAPS